MLDNTFSAGAKIEPVRVERRPYQFTYEDDLGAHFMHTETFEEINIDKNLITNYDLMADGQIVEVMFHTEKETVLSAELPPDRGHGGDLYRAGHKGGTPLRPTRSNPLRSTPVRRFACLCSSTRVTRSASTPAPASITSVSSKLNCSGNRFQSRKCSDRKNGDCFRKQSPFLSLRGGQSPTLYMT